VAELDFPAGRSIAESFSKPWFLSYPKDDHFIEPVIFEEMAEVLASRGKKGSSVQDRNGHVVAFETGGHNIQKSQSAPLVRELLAFYDSNYR
jgi:hypothetical protein